MYVNIFLHTYVIFVVVVSSISGMIFYICAYKTCELGKRNIFLFTLCMRFVEIDGNVGQSSKGILISLFSTWCLTE